MEFSTKTEKNAGETLDVGFTAGRANYAKKLAATLYREAHFTGEMTASNFSGGKIGEKRFDFTKTN